MDNLLNQLNVSQRAAVEFIDGPSLIIAGAGSGKTRVLTYKIAYLLEIGYAPNRILALTFTNKAAREMRERIGTIVDHSLSRRIWMGTFHSVFSRILRNEAEKIGFTKTFTITDSSDSKNLLKTIIKEFQLDDKIYKPNRVQSAISNAKNALMSAQMYAVDKDLIEYDRRAKMPVIKDIYIEYSRRLRAANSMDFDDLLFYTNRLFRDYPDVLAFYQEMFQYILVDEYQDTNFAQYMVIKQLADAHHRVCVVGDDAQSIYSFRGANIDNILNFKQVYPECKLFKLEQNYRSTQNIVNAANSLISKNREQIQKTIFSENGQGERIEVVGAFSDFEEGIIVSNKIWDLRRQQNSNYSEFAILYRTNAQSRIFEEALRKKNIPYRIYGGLSFYHRKEIKDIIAYFRLIINPYDEEAFKRVINYPARGIGNTTVAKIIETAKRQNVSLWQVIGSPIEYNLPVNGGTAKKLKTFRELIENFIEQLSQVSAYELASTVAKQTGILTDAYADQTPEGMSRQENLQELLGGIHEFCDIRQEEGDEQIGLADFLSEVSLLSDQDIDKEADMDKVTMMTIHAAKGLEFENVFVVGLEEDLFPSMMAKNEVRGLEEERRLFYVAMTRAKQFCMLTYARSRFRNGQLNTSSPSRFFKDIDPSYLNINAGSLADTRINKDYHDPVSESNSSSRYSSSDQRPTYRNERPLSSERTNYQTPVVGRKTSMAKALKTTVSSSPLCIQPGNTIRHDRFGIGKVLDVTGEGNSQKATVEFENSGTKQLLLKFARFDIIE